MKYKSIKNKPALSSDEIEQLKKMVQTGFSKCIESSNNEEILSLDDDKKPLTFKEIIFLIKERESVEVDRIGGCLFAINFDLMDRESVLTESDFDSLDIEIETVMSMLKSIRERQFTNNDLIAYKKFINTYCSESIFVEESI